MTDKRDWPRYLVFEGPDGSGKSTLAREVYSALRQLAFGVTSFAFPSRHGEVGRFLRGAFTGERRLSEETMLWLLVADLSENEPRLREAYERSDYVLVDRHPFVSGWVYQSEVFDISAVLSVQQRLHFRQPERVFVLDVPQEVSDERIMARLASASDGSRAAESRNEMYEKRDAAYRERLRQKYIAYVIMHSKHATLLDGTKPTHELVHDVLNALGLGGKS